MPLDIAIVPLGASHERAAFSCGDRGVDHYLHETALSAQQRNLARTKIVVAPHEPTRILGYYTLVYHEYREGELTTSAARKLKASKLRRIPMVLLAQLGVRADLQGQGLGKVLMRDAFMSCIGLLSNVAVAAVIVDPIDQRAANIYTKYGFTRIDPDSPRMMIPIEVLRSALQKESNKSTTDPS